MTAMPEPAVSAEILEMGERSAIAKAKLVKLLRSYPRDTPFEHIIFGYGGVKVTLGDLLDAFSVTR